MACISTGASANALAAICISANKAEDYVVGDNIKEVRDFVAKIKLPNLVFGDICEDYR